MNDQGQFVAYQRFRVRFNFAATDSVIIRIDQLNETLSFDLSSRGLGTEVFCLR